MKEFVILNFPDRLLNKLSETKYRDANFYDPLFKKGNAKLIGTYSKSKLIFEVETNNGFYYVKLEDYENAPEDVVSSIDSLIDDIELNTNLDFVRECCSRNWKSKALEVPQVYASLYHRSGTNVMFLDTYGYMHLVDIAKEGLTLSEGDISTAKYLLEYDPLFGVDVKPQVHKLDNGITLSFGSKGEYRYDITKEISMQVELRFKDTMYITNIEKHVKEFIKTLTNFTGKLSKAQANLIYPAVLESLLYRGRRIRYSDFNNVELEILYPSYLEDTDDTYQEYIINDRTIIINVVSDSEIEDVDEAIEKVKRELKSLSKVYNKINDAVKESSNKY